MTAPALVDLLTRSLGDRVIARSSPRYEEATHVWNGIIRQHPEAVVKCRTGQDIGTALAACREHNVPVTVRGGGHSAAGLSVRDGAVMLDLSGMRAVTVHADRRTITVQGGALWRDVDAASAQHGLATTGGLVSTTGVGGLTLGGGAGWLMRKYGLACDNVLSARVMLADGREVTVSPRDEPDLDWLLRGGGGRFGVVTEYEFRLHPLSTVLAGLLVYPADQAGAVLRRFRSFVERAPDEFCGLAVITHAPPLPFLAPQWHGRPVIILAVCWCGGMAEGAAALQPLRGQGQPLADVIHPMPYVQWQQMQDPGAPAGRCQYWKTASFNTLSDRTIDLLAAAAPALPSPTTELHVQHFGGAIERIPESDSAFGGRNAQFFVNLIGCVIEPAAFTQLRAWVRGFHTNLAREALPNTLTNFSGADDQVLEGQFEAKRAARIVELRHRYDPTGLFATTWGTVA